MIIEFESEDRRADYQLFDSNPMTVGETVITLTPGVVVAWNGTRAFKAANVPSVVEIGVEVAVGATGAVLANAIWSWLSSKLKSPPKTISIDRIEVEFEEGAVKQLLMERIERKESRDL